MYNWSVDEKTLRKNEQQYSIWRLEQMVNFGLGGEKLNTAFVKKHWSELRIDPMRRKFLALLLNEKRDTDGTPKERS